MDKKELKALKETAQFSKEPDSIRELASSEEPEVRWAAANNVYAPMDVLEKLAEDSDSSVSSVASRRLEFKGKQSEPPSPVFLSTLQSNPNLKINKVIGIVYSSESQVASGFSRQSDRLENTADIAFEGLRAAARKHDANAVIGVSLAVNSSQGASAALFGSSEGTIAFGTAVVADFVQLDSSDESSVEKS